jgi:hypothetical protein
MPGIGEITIEQLLPLILKMFPELARVPIVGKIIPLFKIDPEPDANLARKLAKKLDLSPKTFNDEVHVVKVSEVRKCVEGKLGDGAILAAFLVGLGRALVGKEDESAPFILGGKIMECVREKALQQKNKRSVGKYVKTKNTPEPFSEIVSLRRGVLHPFIPPDSG